MIEPIYASEEHKNIIETYIAMCNEFAKDVSSKTKYNNFLDVVETILEYHNNYGKGARENNWYDWLMIIPINTSVMINGYFAGIQSKRNLEIVRSYKVLLDNALEVLVNDLREIEYNNE